MSLISDALKKTQQERNKIREEEEQGLDSFPDDMGKYSSGSGRNKRVLYYIMLGLILAFITTVLIVVSNRGHETVMNALNTSKSTNINKTTTTNTNTNTNTNANANANTNTNLNTVVKAEPQDKLPALPVEEKQEVKQEIKDEVKNESDVKQVNPAVFIKSVEWEEDKENSLKFRVVLSGPVDYKIVPVEETKGRLAVDLKDVQSERIDKPVNRLNVKKLRGWYNMPSVFRLVFKLDYLKDYKVYVQGNELFVEFSGTDLSFTKPAVKAVEEPKKEGKPENKKPGNIKPENIKEVSKNAAVKNKEEGPYEEFAREGDRLIGEKDYLGAVEKYKSALQVRKTPELYHKLYSTFTSMNNNVLAKAYIDDGLKNFPDDFYLNKSAAVVYMKEKDFPRALENVKKASEKNPGDYNLFNYMGMCYYHMKDYAKALYNFQKSLDLNSDAVENYYYIGLIFDNKAQYKKALEYYNAFVKLNREDKNFKHKAWIIQRIKALQEYLNQEDENNK
jgi:tetratricopeptide (TPR) repeat protein